uniref:aspartyl aminopeptidase n=1 Tax=Meloidogyne floridensis TaxID=298350 RepID=A0A915NZJ4_9BILA
MASVGKAVSKDVKQQIRTSALAFLSFLNKSVTPFHAVESCESILRSAGFVELFVNQRLKVQPKGKFYIKSEAIHLDSDRGKFEFNSEQHLRPILAQVSSDNSTKDEKKADKDQL